MRLIKRGLIVFALFSAPFLLLAGAFMIYDQIERARAAEFYDAHPMLRAMRDTGRTESILLQHVPVGSTRSDALRVLSAEGIDCKPDSQSGNTELLVCQPVKIARTRRVPAWYIKLSLDGNGKVLGGSVIPFKSAV
jgi:hypothetical protein